MNIVTVPLPISTAALAQADAFAVRHPNAAKVRRNTLAVWVVNEYLGLMGISTELEKSDSWHPITRLISDTADLITSQGTLECRAIDGTVDLDGNTWNDRTCDVPAEVWDDRVGYIFVQLDEANQMAEILGFLPSVESESVALNQIQPFDDLFDHLYTMNAESVADSLKRSVQTIQSSIQKSTTRLTNWFQDQIDESWQAIENLSLSPAYAFRTRRPAGQMTIVRRGKQLSFGDWTDASKVCQVSLVMAIRSPVVSADSELDANDAEVSTIELSLYPVLPATKLPKGLTVKVVDDDNQVALPPETIVDEELLEIEFAGSIGEEFSVVLQWSEFEVQEYFVI